MPLLLVCLRIVLLLFEDVVGLGVKMVHVPVLYYLLYFFPWATC